MTLEKIILQRLKDNAPTSVSSSLSDRIRFGVIERGCRYPVVRVTALRKPSSERLSDGSQHTTKTATFQIDVFDKTYLDAQKLADNIANHLDGYQGSHADGDDTLIIQLIEVEDVKPGYGSSTETHQHTIDLEILYRRETP